MKSLSLSGLQYQRKIKLQFDWTDLLPWCSCSTLHILPWRQSQSQCSTSFNKFKFYSYLMQRLPSRLQFVYTLRSDYSQRLGNVSFPPRYAIYILIPWTWFDFLPLPAWVSRLNIFSHFHKVGTFWLTHLLPEVPLPATSRVRPEINQDRARPTECH